MIVTFSGKSGSGKDSIVAALRARGVALDPVFSHTTREPRDYERDAMIIDEHTGAMRAEGYVFVTEEEFLAMEDNGDFLWTVRARGDAYGTSKSEVDAALKEDALNVMVLVPDVLRTLHDHAGKVVSFYVLGPPEKELRKRLKKRGDSQEGTEKRIEECKEWDEKALRGDYGVPFVFLRNEGVKGVSDKVVEEVLFHIPQR